MMLRRIVRGSIRGARALPGLIRSRRIEIDQIRSVCLFLGPYRNLSTLTSATLFLHPNCQALNHGGLRIFERRYLDFLHAWSPATFRRFLRFAIDLSTLEKGGGKGGSIAWSHALEEKHPMAKVYRKRSVPILKEKIASFVWKESLWVSRILQEDDIDLARILEAEPRLRFLLPVRNPLDCAQSNHRGGRARQFGLPDDTSLEAILDAVLSHLAFGLEVRDRFPGRVFVFYEHSIDEDILRGLERFLELPADAQWLQDAISVMKPSAHYEHAPVLTEYYRSEVDRLFGPYPEDRAALLAFLEGDV